MLSRKYSPFSPNSFIQRQKEREKKRSSIRCFTSQIPIATDFLLLDQTNARGIQLGLLRE